MTNLIIISWFIAFGVLALSSIWYLVKLHLLQSYISNNNSELSGTLGSKVSLFSNTLGIPKKLKELISVEIDEKIEKDNLRKLARSCLIWYRISSVSFILAVPLTIALMSLGIN